MKYIITSSGFRSCRVARSILTCRGLFLQLDSTDWPFSVACRRSVNTEHSVAMPSCGTTGLAQYRYSIRVTFTCGPAARFFFVPTVRAQILGSSFVPYILLYNIMYGYCHTERVDRSIHEASSVLCETTKASPAGTPWMRRQVPLHAQL